MSAYLYSKTTFQILKIIKQKRLREMCVVLACCFFSLCVDSVITHKNFIIFNCQYMFLGNIDAISSRNWNTPNWNSVGIIDSVGLRWFCLINKLIKQIKFVIVFFYSTNLITFQSKTHLNCFFFQMASFSHSSNVFSCRLPLCYFVMVHEFFGLCRIYTLFWVWKKVGFF